MRIFVAGLVLGLLVSAAAGQLSREKQGGGTPAVKLMKPGAGEAARVLAYAIPDGTRLQCEVDVKISSTKGEADGKKSTNVLKRERFEVQLTVAGKEPGGYRVFVKVQDLAFLTADGKRATDALSRMIEAGFKGSQGEFLLPDHALPTGLRLKDEAHGTSVEHILLPIAALFGPYPAEPVGTGARWSAPALYFGDRTLEEPPADDIETFELTSRGDELEVRRSRQQGAFPEVMGGVAVGRLMNSPRVSYSSLVRVNPKTLLPTAGRVQREITSVEMVEGRPVSSTETQAWTVIVSEVRREQPPAGESKAPPEPTLKVIDAGIEPRADLTPRPKIGEIGEYELRLKQGERKAFADKQDPVPLEPEVALRFTLSVAEVSGGWAACDLSVLSAEFVGDKAGIPESKRAAWEQELAAMKGLKSRARFSLTSPKVEFDGKAAGLLTAIEHVRMALPAGPLGVQASWKAEQPPEVAKLFAERGGTYTSAGAVKAIVDGAYQIESTTGVNVSEKRGEVTSNVDSRETRMCVLRPGDLLPSSGQHSLRVRIRSQSKPEIVVYIDQEAHVTLQKLR